MPKLTEERKAELYKKAHELLDRADQILDEVFEKHKEHSTKK